MSTLSIVLPCTELRPRLRGMVAEILQSANQDFEIVVFINSSDAPSDDQFFQGLNDSRLKVVYSKIFLNVAESWTMATKASSGNYVWLLGDDDFVLKEQLESVITTLLKFQPQCFTFNGASYVFPSHLTSDLALGASSHFRISKKYLGRINLSERTKVVRNMFKFNPLVPLNLQLHIFSREIFKLIGGKFEMPYPDHIAITKFYFMSSSILAVDKKLCFVGMSENSYGVSAYSNRVDVGSNYLGLAGLYENPNSEVNILLYFMRIWLLELLKNPDFSHFRVSETNYELRQFSWVIRRILNKQANIANLWKYLTSLTSRKIFNIFFGLISPKNLSKIATTLTKPKGVSQLTGARLTRTDHRPLEEYATSKKSNLTQLGIVGHETI